MLGSGSGLGEAVLKPPSPPPPAQGCLGNPTGGWKVLGFAGEKPQAPAREAAESAASGRLWFAQEEAPDEG